jgi:Na+/H+-dicarboxylate symporter
MKKVPLHLKILIALVLGALFGSFFNVRDNVLIVQYANSGINENVEIVDWEKITFIDDSQSELKKFNSDEQFGIIKYYEGNAKLIHSIKIKYSNSDISYENILKISKENTIATAIKPIGDLFIRLLSFLAIPLVIASLVVGAASLGDVKKLGRIGVKTFVLYIATTAVAISIGLVCANIIQPGNKLSQDAKNKLMQSYQSGTTTSIADDMEIDLIDFVVKIVPKNPFDSLATGNMLQIVFFAVFFGIALTFVTEDSRNSVLGVFNGASEALIKMVGFVMLLAPYGVFALIAATVADFGFDILSTLIWYIFAVLLGLLLHVSLVYLPLLKFFTKVPIKKFFLGMRNAQAIAFSTSSSAATLPITMDCVENNLGVSKKISGFVLPLGATINMDGTALYQGVAAVFIAQVYGMDLGLTEQLTIVFTAVLASIGTAPVPGVGIIMLVMILQAVHIPPEGIALIIGVDRILDMARTINNITGDSTVALVIAEGEKEI